jgi:hypothetical protein
LPPVFDNAFFIVGVILTPLGMISIVFALLHPAFLILTALLVGIGLTMFGYWMFRDRPRAIATRARRRAEFARSIPAWGRIVNIELTGAHHAPQTEPGIGVITHHGYRWTIDPLLPRQAVTAQTPSQPVVAMADVAVPVGLAHWVHQGSFVAMAYDGVSGSATVFAIVLPTGQLTPLF